MKKPMQFMKVVVVATLLSMPVAVAVFVVLQLKTGLDPSPYLTALAPVGAAELAFTAALKFMERWKDKKNEKDDTDAQGFIVGFAQDDDESEVDNDI